MKKQDKYWVTRDILNQAKKDAARVLCNAFFFEPNHQTLLDGISELVRVVLKTVEVAESLLPDSNRDKKTTKFIC